MITADDVTVRDVTVRGGEHGIEVDDADSVELDGVVVEGVELDGIHVRRGQVEIRDCTVRSLPAAYVQGIDISFGFDKAPSLVEGCTVTGGLEGIVTHFALRARARQPRQRHGAARDHDDGDVDGRRSRTTRSTAPSGSGIFCGDYSHCEIEDNSVSDVAPDGDSGDPMRQGVAIHSHFGAEAELGRNAITRSPGGIAASAEATIERE